MPEIGNHLLGRKPSPMRVYGVGGASAFERIVRRVTLETNGCWTLPPTSHNDGYVRISDKGRMRYAHRVVYERLYGELPPGREIDHLCRARNCANPQHMEVVTHQENVRRAGPRRRVAQCKRGHLFTEENTYTEKDGRRHCRICRRKNMSDFRKRNPGYFRRYG